MTELGVGFVKPKTCKLSYLILRSMCNLKQKINVCACAVSI